MGPRAIAITPSTIVLPSSGPDTFSGWFHRQKESRGNWSYHFFCGHIDRNVVIKAAETAEKEWSAFLGERDATINEIRELRQRVVEEEARKQAERDAAKAEDNTRPDPVDNNEQTGSIKPEPSPPEAKMDVDETLAEEGHGSVSKQDSSRPDEQERKDDSATMPADDDDAVEY
jgi:hypothetical protein